MRSCLSTKAREGSSLRKMATMLLHSLRGSLPQHDYATTASAGSQSESGGAASSPLMFNSAGLQVQCKTELHLAPSSSKMGSSSEACQPLVAQAQGAEMPALPSACQAGSTAGEGVGNTTVFLRVRTCSMCWPIAHRRQQVVPLEFTY